MGRSGKTSTKQLSAEGLPPPVWGEAIYESKEEALERITPTSVGRSIAVQSLITAVCRITPTSVGRSTSAVHSDVNTEDYPHQCGEKHFRRSLWRKHWGLPPPVWGEVFLIILDKTFIRITPTSVGRRQNHSLPISSCKDYPHQCGEKSSVTFMNCVLAGLPPPVWGEAKNSTRPPLFVGITPTSVGRRLKKRC